MWALLRRLPSKRVGGACVVQSTEVHTNSGQLPSLCNIPVRRKFEIISHSSRDYDNDRLG